ncbi:MAG: hypothetical protein JXB88_03120 [Spirochaetales bacterium]|nr:hypothetical protein [Spirochaetales bacterium]
MIRGEPILKKPDNDSNQPLLNDDFIPQEENNQMKILHKHKGIFTSAILKETINLLPQFPDTRSTDEIKEYLRKNLHFSAENTRQRYSNYIVKRTFPYGYADSAIKRIAKAYPYGQALKDICFYRFIKAEILQFEIMIDLLIPQRGNGFIKRESIRDYLFQKYPKSKSITKGAQAIVDALGASNIVKVKNDRMNYGYRDINLISFAFILHSEFHKPNMYDFRNIESNNYMKALLWKENKKIPALYELRNLGLISKISEIDNMRQFTTKFYLDQVVTHIIEKGIKDENY